MNIEKCNEKVSKFRKYIKETYKNKISAILILVLCIVSIKIENDLTVLLLLGPLCVYLFFSKKNWIMSSEKDRA